MYTTRGTSRIKYSPIYQDFYYEYRHVILPPYNFEKIPKDRLLTVREWRDAGIQLERGWENFVLHNPNRDLLLFRRRLVFPLMCKRRFG